ncbi:hypothetical protein Ga0080559_TMP4540 [Salipiger profundus]|uniref:Uncharacterized protein n=1 Tax=Salipiger profundus TaxID=1229727 RepID=A0A1U7DB86_9RHOB|nr:hypothetical protein Ga0080559_TMP4540 [Salipiger profundus]
MLHGEGAPRRELDRPIRVPCWCIAAIPRRDWSMTRKTLPRSQRAVSVPNDCRNSPAVFRAIRWDILGTPFPRPTWFPKY